MTHSKGPVIHQHKILAGGQVSVGTVESHLNVSEVVRLLIRDIKQLRLPNDQEGLSCVHILSYSENVIARPCGRGGEGRGEEGRGGEERGEYSANIMRGIEYRIRQSRKEWNKRERKEGRKARGREGKENKRGKKREEKGRG